MLTALSYLDEDEQDDMEDKYDRIPIDCDILMSLAPSGKIYCAIKKHTDIYEIMEINQKKDKGKEQSIVFEM